MKCRSPAHFFNGAIFCLKDFATFAVVDDVSVNEYLAEALSSCDIICNSQEDTHFCISVLYSVKLALLGILGREISSLSDTDSSCYLKLYDEDAKGLLLGCLLCSSSHRSGYAAMTSL